jgi:tight adherence protein B
MTTLVVAAVGVAANAWLARAARRFAVLDRVRVRPPRGLPVRLRTRLEPMLERAAIEMPAEQVVQLWLLVALVAFVCGLALSLHLAGAGALAVLVGGPLALHALRHRRDRAVRAAVPDMLERVASELRAGGTVATSIAWLAAQGGALGGDFARVQLRLDLGGSLPGALEAWAHERSGPTAASAAGALAVAHDVGGRSADALESLSASLRERRGIVDETRALSAQARYSAFVIGIGPLGYLAFSGVVDHRAIGSLVSTPIGRVCALAGLALEGAGVWWMRRILAAGVPE